MKTNNCVIFVGKNVPAHLLIDLFNARSLNSKLGCISIKKIETMDDELKIMPEQSTDGGEQKGA